MEKQYLFISWNDRPPINARNAWRVNGEIEYKDGKLVFQIANGSNVSIDPDQLNYIGITKTKEEQEAEFEALKAKYHPDK